MFKRDVLAAHELGGMQEEVRMMTRFLAAALVMLALAAPARAAGSEDLQVFRDVQKQVLQYSQFTIFDSVNAEIEDGVVVLTGKVTMPYKRNDIEKRIAKLDTVTEVQNKIEVLPVSQYDDELRLRISRAIYGNSNFWRYATMVNPPIHIIVDRGHVTLEGVVNNNVDRMLARSLASGFGAFSVKNELKTDAEVQQQLESL
jgi:hyperosmotically inducible protein